MEEQENGGFIGGVKKVLNMYHTMYHTVRNNVS